MSTPLHPTPRGWEPDPARPPHTLASWVHALTQPAHLTSQRTPPTQEPPTRRTTAPAPAHDAQNPTQHDGSSDFRTPPFSDTRVSLRVLCGLRATGGQPHQNFNAAFGTVAARPGPAEHFYPGFDDGGPRARRGVGGQSRSVVLDADSSTLALAG